MDNECSYKKICRNLLEFPDCLCYTKNSRNILDALDNVIYSWIFTKKIERKKLVSKCNYNLAGVVLTLIKDKYPKYSISNNIQVRSYDKINIKPLVGSVIYKYRNGMCRLHKDPVYVFYCVGSKTNINLCNECLNVVVDVAENIIYEFGKKICGIVFFLSFILSHYVDIDCCRQILYKYIESLLVLSNDTLKLFLECSRDNYIS